MNKVKIGVIGAGWWATENHIPHLAERDEVELTSVCKLEEDQLSFVLGNTKNTISTKNTICLYYVEIIQIIKKIQKI